MMHDPRYVINNQKIYGFDQQMASCAQYNNGGNCFLYQPGPVQNGNYFMETSSCLTERISEPVYDIRRFSPPQLDTPPLRDMSFDGNSMMVEAANQSRSSFQPPHHHPFSQTEKFDRRKISVHANFYNYQVPFDERRRDAQQAFNTNSWRKQSQQQMQMTAPQRKFSQPIEMVLSSPSDFSQATVAPFQQDTMLSPQPIKKEVSFSDAMDTEPVRKKSSVKEQPPSRKNSGPQRRHANILTRKASQMATKSQLRAPRYGHTTTTKYTPPPILSPMRNGTGLFWQACKGLAQSNQTATTVAATSTPADAQMTQAQNDDAEMSDDSPGLKIDDTPGTSEMTPPILSIFGNNNNNEPGPLRKKGFFYMASQINQPNFAEELEALRKESLASTSSRSGEDAYRKYSNNFGRKESTMEEVEAMEEESDDDIIVPAFSDANPHINISHSFQARVFKWKDRDISEAELNSIEDRDMLVFSKDVLDGIDPKQIEAFELLSCSQAVPNPGRNKELALHILMENCGNIESAVADLLRSDTLDWEQYPIVFGTTYSDSCSWSPEEVSSFQDAIYKSEKDFHQVAQETVGSKSVKECIEFYYSWKKSCPDDYRKLRNLRRKRQLLEINMQNMEEGLAIKKCSLEETMPADDEVEVVSEKGNSSYQGLMDLEPRPHASSFSSLLAMASPVSAEITTSSQSAFRSTSPKELSSIQRNYQPSVPRASITSSSKKGAQPSADGFFHCRLCDKCFEKVKSLNAHMKSHAMKARAEAEAKAQVDAQMAAQTQQMNPTQFPNGALNLGNLQANLQGLTAGITQGMSPNSQLNPQNLSLTQNLLQQQGLSGIPQHARNAIPLLQQRIQQHTTPIIN